MTSQQNKFPLTHPAQRFVLWEGNLHFALLDNVDEDDNLTQNAQEALDFIDESDVQQLMQIRRLIEDIDHNVTPGIAEMRAVLGERYADAIAAAARGESQLPALTGRLDFWFNQEMAMSRTFSASLHELLVLTMPEAEANRVRDRLRQLPDRQAAQAQATIDGVM